MLSFLSRSLCANKRPVSSSRLCSGGIAVAPQAVREKESAVFLFPGQGSQFIGMASKLRQYPQAVQLFDIASEILGYDLLKTCMAGPFDYLTRTDVSQPAIFVTSLAALVKLQSENPNASKSCKASAGLSLGEYSSLVFSGCMSFEDAVSVVKMRGLAMQEASEQFRGGMISVMLNGNSNLAECINSALEHCQSLRIESPVCQASNFLSATVQVVGGSIEAIDYIQENAGKFGIRRVKKLPVSGAFHTDMMSAACERLSAAIKTVKLREPRFPIISNVTAKPYKNVEEIEELLVRQVVAPVKWRQTMQYIFEADVSQKTVYELGPGRQLKALISSSIEEKYRNQHFYNFVDV